jgi:hypothetical protein
LGNKKTAERTDLGQSARLRVAPVGSRMEQYTRFARTTQRLLCCQAAQSKTVQFFEGKLERPLSKFRVSNARFWHHPEVMN